MTAVDEKNIIVVKELEPNDGHTELEKIAENMYTLLKEDGEEDILIAYGTVVNDIKEVSKSYKEAKLALDVGKIFFSEKCYCIQCFGNWTSDLSASDSAV